MKSRPMLLTAGGSPAPGSGGSGLRPGPVAGPTAARIGAGLEGAAFLVLLLVTAMRPLLAETYESSAPLFAGALADLKSPTPATTAGFDLAIWLSAVAATLARLLHRRRWRPTGLELGLAFALLAAIISTWTAGNKRLAINASVDWLSAGALVIVLANLCRDRRRTGLVLAAIIASGLASAAASVLQVTVDFERTREEYERNKADLWKDRAPDDPHIQLYERRLRANEATAFLSHSNVAGSLFLLAGFAALAAGGMAGQRPIRWLAYAAGAALLAVIPLTGSKGALLASLAGVVLMAGLFAARRWPARYPRGAFAALAAATAGMAGLAVLLARARGGLPGASLDFRWNYWEVTARIARDHLWTGVGALNFDRAYLACKPIAFPEEIKDPHNFLLSVLVQWGLPGLIGLLLALSGGAWVAWRRWVGELRMADRGSRTEGDPCPAVGKTRRADTT
ncbi:MAG: O-antigen ligase family protein, partial [Phycisphaerae bacterium]